MKILILSAEVWRDDTNGGNVLTNIFSGMNAEFAQVYCNPGNPDNQLCHHYFQITDQMILKNLLRKEKIGNVFCTEKYGDNNENIDFADTNDLKKNKFLNILKSNTLNLIREIAWNISDWKNSELQKFIIDFNPDIIFAPCYGSHFMLALTRHVAELTNKPVISYISDDHYSLKQYSLSPIYWTNKFLLRRNLRKTFPYYDLTYTMTDEQLRECQKAFNCNIKILKKSGDFDSEPNIYKSKKKSKPIKLVYAGGIYIGRWKTLAKISEAITELNRDEINYVLDIYTGNSLNKKQKKLLNDGENSRVHGLVNQEKLKEIYRNADIALHVEDFGLKNKLTTRISFSTKIIDLLDSSCAVMAVAWNKHSGYTYLKENDIAICIDNVKEIKKHLIEILDDSEKISEYSEKALAFGYENHQKQQIIQEINNDFLRVGEMNK